MAALPLKLWPQWCGPLALRNSPSSAKKPTMPSTSRRAKASAISCRRSRVTSGVTGGAAFPSMIRSLSLDRDRHSGHLLGGAEHHHRLHMADVGGGGEPRRQELLILIPGLGHDLQQKIGLARQHVALANLVPAGDQVLERLEIGLGLAVQPDQREHGDAVAQGFGAEFGMIALDDAGALKGADPAQAGGGGNASALRQIDVGHATVGLQIAENAPIDSIELCAGHLGFPPLAALYARTMPSTQ